ncbi:MAG: MobF family relaxase, partial [Acidimicrobiales bacterium]
MRFTVTPLGSAGGRTVGQVVGDIVRYLEPRIPDAPSVTPAVPGGDGPTSYYADRGTEAGRWLGYGAREAGLAGAVDPADFARVLSGRDPRTGSRLITAQGSAGWRATLGAGTETRRAGDGTPLYDIADAAAALDITTREAGGLVAAGERIAMRAGAALFGGSPGAPEPEGSYLVPVIDDDGNRWITEAELGRCERARAVGTTPNEIESAGSPDDQFSLDEAARLTGVTPRYLRGLCKRYADNRAEIGKALEDGKPPRRAFVVAYRGTKGQWIVKREDLVAFLHRRSAPAVRVGYDLTLTTEKSLGVLALLGTDEIRSGVLDAIQAGNDAGLAHLEYHAAARSKGQPVLVRGVTIASFRHLTSRALDPFPHHHNVVANTVVDEHGTRRALDARALYWRAQEASALATAEMRYQLTTVLGVRWRPGRSGGWEIDGISDDVVREFSRRRTEIEDALAELEEAIGRRSTLDEVQAIVASTRPAKEEVDPSRLVAGWWDRARRLGLDPDALGRCTGHAQLPAPPGFDREAVFADLTSPEHGLCAGSSIFTRSDALSALANAPVAFPDGTMQPLLLPAADLERLADEFLASDHVIELLARNLPPSSRLAREPIFTTPEILGVQHRILHRYRDGLGVGAATVAPEAIDDALGGEPGMVEE